MANSKNTQQVKNIEIVVHHFEDSKLVKGYKALCEAGTFMNDDFGLEVEGFIPYTVAIKDFICKYYVGKRVSLKLEYSSKLNAYVATKVSVVEEGGLKI